MASIILVKLRKPYYFTKNKNTMITKIHKPYTINKHEKSKDTRI